MKLSTLAIILLYTIVLTAINYPYFGLPILFSDDGETLIHVFALLSDKVPYRDMYTHHFTGYVLPLFALAKLIGFSIDLIRIGFIINQVILGFGVYLCAKLLSTKRIAFIAGLIAICAREPFVYSFFPLHQVAVCFIYIFWFSLLYIEKRQSIYIIVASFLTGIGFCIDQRALLISLVVFFALLVTKPFGLKGKAKSIIISSLAFAIIPFLGLLFFYSNNLLSSFIDQTLAFPARYRVASLSFAEQLLMTLKAHSFLVTETPLLFIFALIGLCGLIRSNSVKKEVRQFILLSAIAPLLITHLGGRNYSYYSIPWIPYLALLSIFSKEIFDRSVLLKERFLLVFLLPLFTTLLAMPQFIEYRSELAKRDEALLIADQIRQEIKADDSLFIFGYRPDIYASIPQLPNSPFINVISIHPDTSIKTREERRSHINPIMEYEFIKHFQESPPTYLVYVDLKLPDADWSPAADFVKAQLADNYTLLRAFDGPQVEDKKTELRLYKINLKNPQI